MCLCQFFLAALHFVKLTKSVRQTHGGVCAKQEDIMEVDAKTRLKLIKKNKFIMLERK